MTNEIRNPGVYPKDSDIIPYSPRREFYFMPSNEKPNPGVYPKDSDIIPYSPRREFYFMPSDNIPNNGTITIDSMRDMNIDQIVELYKNGYRIDTSPTTIESTKIESASSGITVSSDILMLAGIGILAYIFIIKR